HQVPAFEIDHLRVASAAHLSDWQDGADAAILDQHGTIRPYLRLDAVDQVRMRKDCLHYGLFRLKLEIFGSNSGTQAQIDVADKRGPAGRLSKRQGLAQTLACQPNKLTSGEDDLTSG